MSTAENLLFMPPDDELRSFLDAEQLTDVVEDSDRVAMDVWVDRRLQVLASIAAEVEHNNQVAARRIHMIADARDEQNAILQRRAAYLEGILEQVAAAYPYPKGKSRKLPFGEIGVRTQKPKLVVDDPTTVLVYAKEMGLPAEIIRLKEEINKVALNEYVESTGEDIPGTHVEAAVERPYVKAKVEA